MFKTRAEIAVLCLLAFLSAEGAPLTLPYRKRPTWLREEGIVMAGDWEPLIFRVRRDGKGRVFTPTEAQRRLFALEHSEEMLGRLKDLGVNFIMTHCYKAFGMEAERKSMHEAARFAALCRKMDFHVGVYTYSGTLGWELFFKEVPEAEDWVVLDWKGRPRTYGSVTYRYFWNRNHPQAQAYHRKIVRFAVETIKADLLHFDNYSVGPGWDRYSIKRFREFLRNSFSPERLRAAGIEDPARVMPPPPGSRNSFLGRAFQLFSCRSLADSYLDMGRYARSLRSDILLECNPGGVRNRIRPPVHHGLLLQGGEAFWDEGPPVGWRNGKLYSRIRTYKVARCMGNMAFAYTTTPLEMAESMAFNLDCLGCVCWFEWGRIVNRPGSKEPVSQNVRPYVRFFRNRPDIFKGTEVVADVAVLRSFPSQVFARPQVSGLTAGVEQDLILQRIPFQIIFDHQLPELKKYRVLILAGCIAMGDSRISPIKRFVRSGGKLLLVGPAALYDEWLEPRMRAAFEGLSGVEKADRKEVVEKLRKLLGPELSLSVEGPPGLCAELTGKKDRLLVHLVNYRPAEAPGPVNVDLKVPERKTVREVVVASPERTVDLPVRFKVHKDVRKERVSFEVPRVGVYEIAVVRLSAD